MSAIWINKSIHGLTNSHNLHITKLFIAQSVVCTMAGVVCHYPCAMESFLTSIKEVLLWSFGALITFILSLQTWWQICTWTDLEWHFVLRVHCTVICTSYYCFIANKSVYLISRDMRLIEHDSLHNFMHLTPSKNFWFDFFSSPLVKCHRNSNHDLHFMINLGWQKIVNERKIYAMISCYCRSRFSTKRC